MVKKFTEEDVTSQHQMKSSAQRVLRSKVLQTFENMSTVIDDIIPKKSLVVLAKCHNHLQIAIAENKPLFFQIREGPWIPTLRVIHQYPNILPRMQVDYGAIKHVLRGSNIMCPGLTSPGGWIQPGLTNGTVVQIHAEGKESACGVGVMTMDSNEIPIVNKGVCIEVFHTLGDGLWQHPSFG